MIINKSNAMSTVKKEQSNNGSNSTIKNDSTQSSESKFTGEPQSSLDSSDSGQSYMSVDGTPFAIVNAKRNMSLSWEWTSYRPENSTQSKRRKHTSKKNPGRYYGQPLCGS